MQNRHPPTHGGPNRANDYGATVKNNMQPNQNYVPNQAYQYTRNQGQAMFAPTQAYDNFVYMYQPTQPQLTQRPFIFNGQTAGIMNIPPYQYYTAQSYQPTQQQQQQQPQQQQQQQQQQAQQVQVPITYQMAPPLKTARKIIDIVDPTTGEKINLTKVTKETNTHVPNNSGFAAGNNINAASFVGSSVAATIGYMPPYQRNQPPPPLPPTSHTTMVEVDVDHALTVKEQFASKVAATLQASHHHNDDDFAPNEQNTVESNSSPKTAIEAPQLGAIVHQEPQQQYNVVASVEHVPQQHVDVSHQFFEPITEQQFADPVLSIDSNVKLNSVEINNVATVNDVSNKIVEVDQQQQQQQQSQYWPTNKNVETEEHTDTQQQYKPPQHEPQNKHNNHNHELPQQQQQQTKPQQQQTKTQQQQKKHQPQHQQQQYANAVATTTQQQQPATKNVDKESPVDAKPDEGESEWIETTKRGKKRNKGGNKDLSNHQEKHQQQHGSQQHQQQQQHTSQQQHHHQQQHHENAGPSKPTPPTTQEAQSTQAKTNTASSSSQPITNDQPQPAPPTKPVNPPPPVWPSIKSTTTATSHLQQQQQQQPTAASVVSQQKPPTNQQSAPVSKPGQQMKQATPPPSQSANQTQGPTSSANGKTKQHAPVIGDSLSHNDSQVNKGKHSKRDEPVSKQPEKPKIEQKQEKLQDKGKQQQQQQQQQSSKKQNKQQQKQSQIAADKNKSDDKKQMKSQEDEKKEKSDKVNKIAEIPVDAKNTHQEITPEVGEVVDKSEKVDVVDVKQQEPEQQQQQPPVAVINEKESTTAVQYLPPQQQQELETTTKVTSLPPLPPSSSSRQSTPPPPPAAVQQQQPTPAPVQQEPQEQQRSTPPPPPSTTSSSSTTTKVTTPEELETTVSEETTTTSTITTTEVQPNVEQEIHNEIVTETSNISKLENTTTTVATTTTTTTTTNVTPTTTTTATTTSTTDIDCVSSVDNGVGSVAETELSKSESADDIDEKDKLVRKDSKPQLRYTYAEDQWSPINPEGKKCYDRNFLLQVQFSDAITKPDLPQLDIVLSKPNISRQDSLLSNASSSGEQTPTLDFTNYVRSSSSSMNRGYPNKKGMGGQNQAKRQLSNDQGQRKVIDLKLQNDIQLHTADNAWKPKKEDLDETEIVYKKVRAILNKLTPQKFQTLIGQVKHLPINTEDRLSGCINIIFEKAVSEPNFAIAYANMAKCLIGLNVPLNSKPEETVSFRKLLLTKCQTEFEKDKEEEEEIATIQQKIDDATTDEEKKKLTEEKNNAMWRAKRRSLGNIRFIGELFKLKMLTEKIMHECLSKLLRQAEDEDSLECLCQLMSTIGKDIDQGTSKIHMDAYCDKMRSFVDMKRTTHRIRFMILDVFDLRKSSWIPRREKNNPKTIDQIHKEAKREEEERQQKTAMFDQAQRKKHAEHRFNQSNLMSPQSSSASGGIKDDGWTSVSRPPKATPLDMSKIKLTRTNVDDNIQLGPGGRGGWGRGSMGGAALKVAPPPEPEKPMLNRYALLSNSIDSTDPTRISGTSQQLGSRDTSYKGRSSGPQNQPKVQTLSRGSQEKASYQSSEERSKSPQPPSLRPMNAMTMGPPTSTVPIATTALLGATAAVKKITGARPLSAEDIERKTKSIVDEYLHLKDIKEALDCLKELSIQENELNARRFFYYSLEHSIERSSQVRGQIGALHRHLLKKDLVISPLCYTAAVTRLTHFAIEAVIDIPQVWEYIGEIVCPLFLEGHEIPLKFLVAPISRIEGEDEYEFCAEDVKDNRARLMAVVMEALSKQLGHHAANDLWKKSKLKWEDLVKETPVKEFIKEYNLEYTVVPDDTHSRSRRSRLVSVNENKNELIDLFVDPTTSFQHILDWIHENMYLSEEINNPIDLKSVSDCCSALCMSCLLKRPDSDDYQLEEERIIKFLPVIKTLTVDRPDRQVEVLFGLQELAARLAHPPNLLHRLFELLYDAEVTNEQAFQQWRDDTTRLASGKGVALHSVHRFFDWLAEEERANQAED